MYNLDALRRKIAKEGFQATFDFLVSENLDSKVKEDLTENHVFSRDGRLCLSLLYSL